jgi:hypothetical protein
MGVLQLINNLAGVPFSGLHDEGVVEVAKTLAIAFRVRQQMPGQISSKFEYLVVDNVIAAAELELATRTARRKGKNVEDILIDEFQVKPEAIGAALAKFFGVEYEPFKQDRVKPPELLKNIKRDYAEQNHWIPVDEGPKGITIMSTDPERVRSSRMADNVFPRSKMLYKVTTERDFVSTLNHFFGAESAGGGESINDMLSSLDDEEAGSGEGGGADDISAAADNELVKLVNKIIVDAYNQNASDIHVEPLPGKGKTGIRFRKDGSLGPYIEIPASYRNPLVTRLKIMCDLDISEKRKPQDGKIKFKKFGPSTSSCAWRRYRPPAGSRTSSCGSSRPANPSRSTSSACCPSTWSGSRGASEALWPLLRVRADGLRQDHHAALGAGPPEHPGEQDLDGGGSRRDHAEGPSPVPGQSEGGVHLRRRDEVLPARRSGHHHGR